MPSHAATAGVLRGGLPYNRFGRGSRVVVIFQGLLFENRPLTGPMASVMLRMYRFLGENHTTYIVTRKPGLPDGHSMQDMADDYATMIREEFGKAVDIIGVSTGGSIAQHFAALHPDLVRRLVIHSSAFRLRDEAKVVQMRVAELAHRHCWRGAYAALMGLSLPRSFAARCLLSPLVWFGSLFGGLFFGSPTDPSDLVTTIEAEDEHDFEDRLGEIISPTLVVGGTKDPFYSVDLFRRTAEGIPNAKLVLYEGMGHPASGQRFRRDVLAFLDAETEV